ncbi:DNA endonuclease SmrA [Aestuariibacter halophilus]|uniref:DNA endonuclease SmrA n=1 Tax=Fluctibacter halophilus TaxID=226011 RepID=A0ABS8G4E3_9ALTE|nr:DNA endonuclease SmrA [Aestuariibacter halophilus]MCC2614976.1 DNA endonuclease SmrA [Aestuariibacter halophilus]
MWNDEQGPQDDFAEWMQDVKPLKQDTHISSAAKSPSLAQQLRRAAVERETHVLVNPLSAELPAPVAPNDPIGFKKPGVQEGVYKNLRLGKYSVDHRLNVQGLSVERARDKLFFGLRQAQQNNHRTVLIKHGKQPDSEPFPGLLKSHVNQWLQSLPQVLAFHSAQPFHGGNGAVYVLLQKSAEEKQTNRERHKQK